MPVKPIQTFANEGQKRDSIIESLRQVKETYGWVVIRKAMEEDIKAIEAKLHGEIPLLDSETIKGLQEQRIDRIGLRDIIENLIERYSDAESFPPSLDPFN